MLHRPGNALAWPVRAKAMTSPQDEAFHAKGDALLALDSGLQLPVHSVYLEPRSKVLAEAIALATSSSQRSKHSKLRVPLPSTPDSEVELLLTALYSLRPETLLHGWETPQLLALARVCHRFAVEELLTMVDEVCLTMVHLLLLRQLQVSAASLH